MDKEIFEQRLEQAAEETIVFTRSLVTEVLPNERIYKVFPNKHGEMKQLRGDAEVFPQDSLPRGQFIGPLDATEVVAYLWRNGKVPEWIDISVDAVEGNRTVLILWCCGHFTSFPANTFHRLVDPIGRGAPFSVHGPFAPKGWKKGDGAFSLANAQHYY